MHVPSKTLKPKEEEARKKKEDDDRKKAEAEAKKREEERLRRLEEIRSLHEQSTRDAPALARRNYELLSMEEAVTKHKEWERFLQCNPLPDASLLSLPKPAVLPPTLLVTAAAAAATASQTTTALPAAPAPLPLHRSICLKRWAPTVWCWRLWLCPALHPMQQLQVQVQVQVQVQGRV